MAKTVISISEGGSGAVDLVMDGGGFAAGMSGGAGVGAGA